MKRIPYGVSNYKKIIVDDSLYIDKTHFIKLLENKYNFLSFLRPRRFGKSLFISTLQYYYDEYYADIWENLFKDTYIGKNPTKLKSSYRILFMEFAGISTQNMDSIYKGFTFSVKTNLKSYLRKYKYNEQVIETLNNIDDPENLIKEFFEITKNDKIYILIDEYDNFANSLLGESIDNFKKILGKGGFVRSFYEVIKAATQTGVVDRMFVTGVTQITMDSMTSGFNIIRDITKDEDFNELVGFNTEETKLVLNNIFTQCKNIDKEWLLNKVVKLYNGYKFSIKAKERVFNSTMVMFFVSEFDIKRCEFPRELLDFNVASDYRKIMQLFEIGDTEDNYKVLNELIENNQTTANLKSKIEFDKGFFRDDFVTLLYSMGFVTIKDEILGDTIFTIPNYTIKTLYFDYFQIEIENRNQMKFDIRGIRSAITEMALNNNLQGFQKELKSVINLLSNRDYMKFEEKHLKVIALTVLNIAKFYYIKSEAEYNNKYPDIMLLKQEPFDVKFQFLFELKWVKKGIIHPAKSKQLDSAPLHISVKQKEGNKSWENKKEEGINQIKGYLQLPDIKKLKNLRSYLIVSDGDELEIIEVEK